MSSDAALVIIPGYVPCLAIECTRIFYSPLKFGLCTFDTEFYYRIINIHNTNKQSTKQYLDILFRQILEERCLGADDLLYQVALAFLQL